MIRHVRSRVCPAFGPRRKSWALPHLSAEAVCFVRGGGIGTVDRQMEVHGPKLCEEDLMFETVCAPQSWNSVASFNWSNADNLPSTPQFSPSRPSRVYHQWRYRAEGQIMVSLGAPGSWCRVLACKIQKLKRSRSQWSIRNGRIYILRYIPFRGN
jgi:hypothetical protein